MSILDLIFGINKYPWVHTDMNEWLNEQINERDGTSFPLRRIPNTTSRQEVKLNSSSPLLKGELDLVTCF